MKAESRSLTSVWYLPHQEIPDVQQLPDKEATLPSLQILAIGPRQANLVLIAYASSEGSGEPAHPRSLARTFAARSYKQ